MCGYNFICTYLGSNFFNFPRVELMSTLQVDIQLAPIARASKTLDSTFSMYYDIACKYVLTAHVINHKSSNGTIILTNEYINFRNISFSMQKLYGPCFIFQYEKRLLCS